MSTSISKKKVTKMKVLILRDTIADGKKVSAVYVIELSNDIANTVIS